MEKREQEQPAANQSEGEHKSLMPLIIINNSDHDYITLSCHLCEK